MGLKSVYHYKKLSERDHAETDQSPSNGYQMLFLWGKNGWRAMQIIHLNLVPWIQGILPQLVHGVVLFQRDNLPLPAATNTTRGHKCLMSSARRLGHKPVNSFWYGGSESVEIYIYATLHCHGVVVDKGKPCILWDWRDIKPFRYV